MSTDINRSLWDGWTRLHESSTFYDLDGFRRGASSLKRIELDEAGEVQDLDFLHLQCHFGQDTLSWARLGAKVTGVDFSAEAIGLARRLSTELDLSATFIQADVLTLPASLSGGFDRVFTSYGVLSWLPDLSIWAVNIARCLRPQGLFHLVEFHPLLDTFSDNGTPFHYPYFKSPLPNTVFGSYAAQDADFTHEAMNWSFSLGEVVTALCEAGLRIESLREYDYSPYPCYPFLIERAPDEFILRGAAPSPHVFSIRARKP